MGLKRENKQLLFTQHLNTMLFRCVWGKALRQISAVYDVTKISSISGVEFQLYENIEFETDA